MTTTVTKTIGASTGNYSTVAAWEAASPSDLTTSRADTTQSGSDASTIKLDSDANGTDEFYTGHAVWCDARPSEKRLITAYNGTTKVATIGALNGSNGTWDNVPGVEAFTVDSVIWEGQLLSADGEHTENNIVFAGQTTSSSAYLHLTAAPGESFVDNEDKLTNALRYNASNGAALTGISNGGQYGVVALVVANCRISGLQIKSTGGTYNFVSGAVGVEAAGCYITNCILQNNIASGTLKACAVGASVGFTVANSLLLVDGGASTVAGIYTNDVQPTVHFCTIVGDAVTGAGIRANYAGVALYNSYIGGFSTSISALGAKSGQNNGTDQASGLPTTNANYNLPDEDQFESVTFASADYRLKSTADLIALGYDDGTAYADADIVGTARPQDTDWDIGAWEYSASGPITVNADSGSFPFTGGTGTPAAYATVAADSGSFPFTGGTGVPEVPNTVFGETGDFAFTGGTGTVIPYLTVAADSGSFPFTGGEGANTWLVISAESGNFRFRGGSVSIPGRGGNGISYSALLAALQPISVPALGGAGTVNPSPPAGDALTQMLATMAVGEFRRISDPTFDMRSGPANVRGYDIYTQPYYDYDYMVPGGRAEDFTDDTSLKYFVQGEAGGGIGNTDNARLVYAGMGLSQSRLLLMVYGGGHTSGGWTHAIYFDILAACTTVGKWDQYTDPAPYSNVQDANWPTVSTVHYPQTIVHANFPVGYTPLGPDNNVAPYALHNYSALAFDETNDQWWVTGGSVAQDGGGVNPNGAWKIDAATRAVTLTTAMSMGGNSARLIMAPGGDYIWWNTTAGYVWYAHNIATETNTLVANNLGVTAAPGNGAACMWIRDLTTVGEYDLVYSYYAATYRLVKCPRQWTGSAPTSPARSAVYAPPGTDETAPQTEEQCYTFEDGVARNWDSNSGFIYVEDQKKIFVFTIDAGEILIQTLDPFQGNATGQATWHVENWLGGYAGLSGEKSGIAWPGAGVNNLVQYLPAYKAAVIVSNESRGDVRILKMAV